MSANSLPGDSTAKTWWKDWFNDIYLDVYSHRDEEQADAEIKTVLDVVPLEPAQRVLDFCCGNGRHSRALHRAGFEHVWGMDYSEALLKQGHGLDIDIQFVRGDMKSPPFLPRRFDAVFSFFTSFGYFDDEQNQGVLEQVGRILKPGGWYLLDYLNPVHVKNTLVPESERDTGAYHINERRAIVDNNTRIEITITISKNGSSQRFCESVRLYEFPEMVRMWERAGLQVKGALGSFEGAAYTETQPRMILFGQRRS